VKATTVSKWESIYFTRINMKLTTGEYTKIRNLDDLAKIHASNAIVYDVGWAMEIQEVIHKHGYCYIERVDKDSVRYLTPSYPIAQHLKFKPLQNTEGTTMKNDLVRKLADQVRPYQKYILIAAALYVADRLLFKGAFTDRLTTLAKSVADRLFTTLEAAADAIGGKK